PGGDSPLVAAAKRTGRLGKKPSNVITNDTLVKTGGHFTTTKSQEPIQTEKKEEAPANNNTINVNGGAKAAPAAEAKKKDDKDSKDKKAAAEAKDKALRRAVADYVGESIENVN